MKKLMTFFISCAAVFLIGLIMFIVGVNTGGVDGLHAVAEDHDWVNEGPGALATVEVGDLDFDSIEATGVADVVIVGENSYDQVIRDYHLETAVDPKPGSVVMVHGSNMEAPASELDGKTLKLFGGSQQDFNGINLDFSSDPVYPTMIVFCPDKQLDQIKISSQFSDVTLQDISFKQADIALNFGDIETKNIESKGMTIVSDEGDVELSGELRGKTSIALEMGDIEIDTKDTLKKYTIKAQSDVGDIIIGKKEIVDDAHAEEGYLYTQNGGDDTLILETKTGDIEVHQIEQ